MEGYRNFYDIQRDAEAGDVESARTAGVMLANTRRYAEAAHFFQIAAGGRLDQGTFDLGTLLIKVGRYEEGLDTLRRAAELGHAEAAFELASLLGDDGDIEYLYRTAARAGHVSAAYNLGIVLERDGRLDEAKTAFRQAALGGNIDAAYNLGVLLQDEGRVAEAARFLRQAADAGDEEAAEALDLLRDTAPAPDDT